MSSAENVAGFLTARWKLEPAVLRHVVERIFCDFDIGHLVVYPIDAAIAFHEETLKDLIEDGWVSVQSRDRLDAGALCLLLSIKPQIAFGTVVPGDLKGFRVPDTLPVLEIDGYGRTVPRMNIAPGEWSDRSTIFTRHTATQEGHEGVMGYSPFFMIYRDVGEVGGNIDRARFVQNEFGFRREKDTPDLTRGDDEILVVVHGGSCAYGVFNSVAQSWPYLLQTGLNRRLSESGDARRRFRVINMAIPSSSVTDCLARHVMLAHRLATDYVIAHVGWNEARNLVSTDPDSLDHGIILHQYHTSVATSFWQSQGTSNAADGRLEFDNSDRHTTASAAALILERLRQFQRIANADGSHFIAGIQPGMSSKTTLHPLEQTLYRDLLFVQGRVSFSRMSFQRTMLQTLEQGLSGASDEGLSTLPFNRLFSKLDNADFWFWDYGHTTAACNAVMAGHYLETIWSHFTGSQT